MGTPPYFNTIKIKKRGCAKIRKDILGKNNSLDIGENSFLRGINIMIHGNNNQISIGSNCYFGPDVSLRIEGDNCKIIIGSQTTVTRLLEINVQESNHKIIIGEDCMFSNRIIVRTSDSHPIINIETKKRINPAADVVIGSHVWIAPNTKIMKGANIGSGCIIGSDTTINKKYPENCLIIGRPSRIVKEKVSWTRDNIL